MQKRRYGQVFSGDDEEDGEIRRGEGSEGEDPKKVRVGGLQEPDDGEAAEEEKEEEGEEARWRARDAEAPRNPWGRGLQEVESRKADSGKDEKRDDAQEDIKTVISDENKLSNGISDNESASSTPDILSREESPGPTIAEIPRSHPSEASEIHVALEKLGALTGDVHRVRWLEKLVQGFRLVGSLEENVSLDNGKKARESFSWPDSALPMIVALEKTVHEALGSDFRKYNQKMRKLDFNFKRNALLTRRFLKGELEPKVILNMTPEELKMADARCSRCAERKVGVVEIIHAGGSGDRYQLECASCGHTWSASIDDVSSLTIDSPRAVGNVGAAPWATAKFEDVERKLLSPHEAGKSSIDLPQREVEPYIPVLETRRSLDKWNPEDVPDSATLAG
ncbi:unnamed protein product [Spirodela intermedia]|uniref:TFIIS central domain-containing protein n=1 Tax=Spirodela intermedia TaxID=51605 RepID=A0A7I8K2T4_SPIIN|nr:unnamed protein product [Spirodela intermedia]